jgi:hypothetical protein
VSRNQIDRDSVERRLEAVERHVGPDGELDPAPSTDPDDAADGEDADGVFRWG